MSDKLSPLDIIKRLDVKQNVTIRIIDEPTGKVVQEHVGHNAATNSLLTGIAHYLMGDGVLNQGFDTLSMWVPQYISLGTMGLTSQESEEIAEDGVTYIVPKAIGATAMAPDSATDIEKELNAQLRFTEYINQTPGFGADGYDDNSNNDRSWFGLGLPYSLRPITRSQDFYNGSDGYNHVLAHTPYIVNASSLKDSIVSVTIYPDGVINQDSHDTTVERSVLATTEYNLVKSSNTYTLQINNTVTIPSGSRIAVIYLVDNNDAANCELIKSKIVKNEIVPETLRSRITYRDLVPEVKSELPNTLDVVYSAMVSVGALREYRNDNDYVYITEAGLWSKPGYDGRGDNGLLAGYRILPSDDAVNILGLERTWESTGAATYNLTDDQDRPLSIISIDSITCDGVVIPSDAYSFEIGYDATALTFDEEHIPASGSTIILIYRSGDVAGTWKDMSILENRQKVQKSILRIGVNQVAQVIWKIQLGGLEQLNGLRYLYPSQYPEEVWELV